MTWNRRNNNSSNDWGGPWTERKLEAFSKYVRSYLKIMKSFPYWETIYFDGFAGSGDRDKEVKTDLYQKLLITEEDEKTYKGSAERVLEINNGLGFDYYYFIDKEESLKKLEVKLADKFSNKKIIYRAGNANDQIIELANALKSKELAALVLLDPFGMQIDWASIEQLKDTRSDVWILIPTGVIVNRLLDKKGELKFSDKLESFFGLSIEEIKSYFYREERAINLFGDEEVIIKKVSEPIEKIAKLYAERMKTIWNFVTDNPLVLYNKNGVPIFHFVFASNNKTATKIAKQIIQGL